tara:strand:+ start:15209 stop:15715 length:507 start_codon:yes stop_codon:yes gene_type:complete
MKKSNINKKHFTIIGIVSVILIGLFFLNKAFPDTNTLTVQQLTAGRDLIAGSTPPAQADVPSQTSDVSNSYTECLGKHNIPSNPVIFVHSNSCPHCRNMVPVIKKLEEEGYSFYWAESGDSEARQMVSDCFSDLMGGYVPQFICPVNAKEHTGEMPYSELKKFSDECK